MASLNSLPRSIRFIVNNGALYAAWAQPIPKLVRWSFLAFVVSLALEGWPIGADVTLPKLFGLLFFACYMAHAGLPLKLSLPPIPGALWGFLIYFLMYAFTGLSMQEEGIRAYVTRLFQLGQYFALFWFASDLLRDPEFAKKSLLSYAIACFCLALGALAGMPGLTPDAPHGRDTTALVVGPNTLAILMACAAIIIIGYCLKEKAWSAKRKAFLLTLALPLFAIIVQTGSRSGVGCLLIGIGVFLVPRLGSKKHKIAFFIAGAVIAVVIFLLLKDPVAVERWTRTIEEGETAGRGDIYAATLEMFSERPLAGWGGLKAFEELALRLGLGGRRDAHNLIFYLLIEVGLLGTVPFLIAIWLCLHSAFKSRHGQLGLIPLSLTLAVLVYNMSHTAIPLKAFWLILGLAVAASAKGREVKYHRALAISNERPTKVSRAPLSAPFHH